MRQVKLFVDIESNIEALEERVNTWLKESHANVINIFGNVAPQTVMRELKTTALSERRYASSDVFIAIEYEAA